MSLNNNDNLAADGAAAAGYANTGVSSLMNKHYVALVIAHELAHQWFGDLVTMNWWTE